MIIFLHPFSRLNSKLYENNLDKKKKIKMNKFASPFFTMYIIKVSL